jgi:hypothetical protein
MSTRRYFSCVNKHSIDDFIPLKRRYLRKKVYCGSFYLKTAISYLFDFMTITQANVYKPPKYLLHLIEPNSKKSILWFILFENGYKLSI